MDKHENRKIIYIPVDKLHSHPDNPRKNIGDVTELAESIKVNGIMQNLTVVPMTGYYYGDYTVIIGHRRLAAAKLAGLEALPCVIVELSEKEQVSVMLTENIQRSDLTVYEQAQGFQLMIDMGDDVTTIAKKTGFSQSTIRRRVKLLKLDEKRFKETEGRQVAISDYEKLFEIQDEDLRNKVLEDIGTSNFRMSFKAALQTDKKNEERKKLIQYLKGIADEIDDAPKEAYKYIGFVGSVHSIKNIIENDRKYYYNLKNPYGISIYTQYSEEEKVVNAAEKATEQEERQRKTEAMSEMEALENRAYECRMDFVKSVYSPNPLIVNSLVAEALLKEKYMWGEGINSTIYSELTGQAYDTVNRNELKANKTEYNAVTMLYLAYATLEKPSKTCRNYAGYTHSITMDVLYEHLEDLGYDVSDEERAMLNGTHELYTRI